MKGGITSGVVYPLAAVRLAEQYRFKNVGGTSAGAIAAAAVAAAEHGRSNGRGTGFDELAELPGWLGANLTSLFQPSGTTKPLFAIALRASAARTRIGTACAVLFAAAFRFPLAALAGALPALVQAATALMGADGPLLVWSLVCALLLLAGGLAAALSIALARRAAHALPANGYGIVSGYETDPLEGKPPLTTWLADLLDRLAGIEAGGVLTFGDLWGHDPEAGREVNLEMITTCLTQGRPYKLPLSGGEFWFDPEEMRLLFPERVVAQMIRGAGEAAPAEGGLLPLPAPSEMPVVVAVRMSLSFPLLISAVPLHAIDYSNPVSAAERQPQRCWFSDGGIASNFPIHLFDSPVPRWPTFAIDLRKLPGGWSPSEVESENVWMPPDNDSRGDEWWNGWEELPPPRQLFAFGRAILATMQNWGDQTQARVHGYRDRIARIEHSATEGGLNLTMPEPVIARLSERGEAAAELLRRRFARPPQDSSPLTWDNHRWLRYRTFMRLLEQALAELRRGLGEPDPPDVPIEALIRQGEQLPEFGWTSAAQRDHAISATADLVALIEDWMNDERDFVAGAPEPSPELRVTPEI